MFYEMKPTPVAAVFLRRVNRFAVEVLLDDQLEVVHLANSGRLTAVLAAGAGCWLRPEPGLARKTRFDLLAVETERGTVVLDAQLPNRLVATAWRQNSLPGFSHYDRLRPEYRFGASRFDLAFFGSLPTPHLVEVKSAADYQQELARFPDAPSLRAVRHLRELTAAVEQGYLATVIFMVQMSWARGLVLNAEVDPLFVSEAHRARELGVNLLAFTIQPTFPEGIAWGEAIPVELP